MATYETNYAGGAETTTDARAICFSETCVPYHRDQEDSGFGEAHIKLLSSTHRVLTDVGRQVIKNRSACADWRSAWWAFHQA